MNQQISYYPFFLNSKDRSSSEVSNFYININGLLKKKPEEYKLHLKKIWSPNDCSNVTDYWKNLLFGTTNTFTFPEANYNSTQLVDYFNANNTLGMTSSFSTQTEHFKFTNR